MITVVINGQNYNYPEVGDTDWGSIATLAFDAITKTTLQPVKDLNDPTAVNDFTLYNDIDFGPTHGLRVVFIQSRSNNPAATGVFRLAKDELVAWRNEDNDGDNTISFDSDGDLIVNGVKVTLHGQIVNDDIAAGAGIEESKLALDYSTDSLHTAIENHVTDTNNPHSVTKSQILTGDLIVNSDVDSSAAIDESKLNLDYSTDSLNTAITTHVSDTNNPHSVTKAQVLTGDLIVNADVDNSAAISESKLDLDYSTSSLNTAITTHTGNTSNPHSTTVANLTDTTITSATNGDVLSYDGSKWVNSPSTSSSLSGLSDTAITTPANGDTLVYDSVSTKWENSNELSTVSSTVSSHVSNTSNPHSTNVSNLTDTTLSSLNYGDRLTYDSNTSKWFNQPNTLGALIDTGISQETNGDALVYDGVQWVNQANTVENLKDVTVSSIADKDTLLYDSNSAEWINVENSIDNLSNTDIDSNTLTENDVLVFNDQTSKWENSQIMVNHIGSTANPHLTTVSNLTDTTISSLADKQLLQYDQANLQWVNSSDVWSTIEVNDIANINSATTNVTLSASDKRHQIFTATDGFNITLPSSGIKAGEIIICDFSGSFSYFPTTSIVFYVGANVFVYCHTKFFRYKFTALVDNPSTTTDWLFEYELQKQPYSITSNRPFPYYEDWIYESTTTTSGTVWSKSSATLFTIPNGVYDIVLRVSIVGGSWSGYDNWWFAGTDTTTGRVLHGNDGQSICITMSKSMQTCESGSLPLNGGTTYSYSALPTMMNALFSNTKRSMNIGAYFALRPSSSGYMEVRIHQCYRLIAPVFSSDIT